MIKISVSEVIGGMAGQAIGWEACPAVFLYIFRLMTTVTIILIAWMRKENQTEIRIVTIITRNSVMCTNEFKTTGSFIMIKIFSIIPVIHIMTHITFGGKSTSGVFFLIIRCMTRKTIGLISRWWTKNQIIIRSMTIAAICF